MLTPEQAKTQLEPWRLPDGNTRYKDELAKLPKSLKAIAEGLYGEAHNSEQGYQRLERVVQSSSACDALKASDRRRIFAIISTHLADSIERSWSLLQTAPYTHGYSLKAFRIPDNPQYTVASRGAWLHLMSRTFRNFKPDILTPIWVATWAAHLSQYRWGAEIGLGQLFAADLDDSCPHADELYEILRQSTTNEHEIAAFGQHVVIALLLSCRQDGWELIEKLLLAAQRQEGLRQSILERVDLSHPEAFRRMLRLILEHDLMRFSSVIRAFDVWFGMQWSALAAGKVKKMLTRVVEFLDQPETRAKALAGKDAEDAYFALWCGATEDALATIPLAEKLLASKKPEFRYIAANHLTNLQLVETGKLLEPLLDDADPRISFSVLMSQCGDMTDATQSSNGTFEKIEKLLKRIPGKSVELEPILWPWTGATVTTEQVTSILLSHRGERPISRIRPYFANIHRYTLARYVDSFVKQTTKWDEETAQAMLELAGDTYSEVRTSALSSLKEQKLTTEHVTILEGYLTRKSGDLRGGVLEVLCNQSDKVALASSERLLAAKDANQRLAGLELLRLLGDANRSKEKCRAQAEAYKASRKKLTRDEETRLTLIAAESKSQATLDDALGLMNPAERATITPPRKIKVTTITKAAVNCLKSLEELVHQHRAESFSVTYAHTRQSFDYVLGAVNHWQFPRPDSTKRPETELTRLPMADIWTTWEKNRPAALRDKDGLELLRAWLWLVTGSHGTRMQFADETEMNKGLQLAYKAFAAGQPEVELRYHVVEPILQWLLFLNPVNAIDYCLDVTEQCFSSIPSNLHHLLTEQQPMATERFFFSNQTTKDWRSISFLTQISKHLLQEVLRLCQVKMTPEQYARYWNLMRWRDQPVPNASRARVDLNVLMAAYDAGAAKLGDVADHLLATRDAGNDYIGNSFDLLKVTTARIPEKPIADWLKHHPEIQTLVNSAVERILDIELVRGDSPTAATVVSHSISSLLGIETLRRLLAALGKDEFKLARYYDTEQLKQRRSTFTKLIKAVFPAANDTPEKFASVMRSAIDEKQFSEERLFQLVFLAPQWVSHVEHYSGWKHLSEGVYWFLAHMRYVSGLDDAAALLVGESGQQDNDSTADSPEDGDADTNTALEAGIDTDSDEDNSDADEKAAPQRRRLSPWERLILERTPLSAYERDEGAIDVNWFKRTYALLGADRWETLAKAARFAANASQARRARFISEVLLNQADRQELIDGIEKRQLKESVRLLGLLPLASGRKRDADLIERCQILQEYRRYANQLSGLTKPSALLALEIGMKNLAQTAGYADALRLEWAFGAEKVKDLTKGSISVTHDKVTFVLSLDEVARPTLVASKDGKELKKVLPAAKKVPKVAELYARVKDIKRQSNATRKSLESAMCRGDTFSGKELREWCGHAILAPLLARLVVWGEGISGYPVSGGKGLSNYAGKVEPVKPNEQLRLAHPYDLLRSGDWHEWQKDCFAAERLQPFKQVFRELYVVTSQEKKDGTVSRRYAGQQIQPTQGMALFGQRGWNTQDGIFKVFHDLQLTVSLNFNYGITTPLEVEGWTVSDITFTDQTSWHPKRLDEVPSRVFSEVMRDIDLVVSVAHAGRVDPETSASTVEMRTALLRETCSLLKRPNVTFKPAHAVIEGRLGMYSVHLGSGVVHKLPGGSMCIVPVHAQHRGRLFLPFADDDPRTAEVISKVLLLSNDHEIQDPIILEQIRR